jgi:hypothetical protein
MSFWNTIGSGVLKGVGYAFGAKMGKDLYDVAHKKVSEVDWEKVRDDADALFQKAAGVVRPDKAREAAEAADPDRADADIGLDPGAPDEMMEAAEMAGVEPEDDGGDDPQDDLED